MPSVPGFVTGGASAIAAADITDAGTTGVELVQAETAADALAELGATATGISLVQAVSASDALAALDPGLPTTGIVARWSASDLVLSDGDPVSTWAPGAGSPGSLTGSGSARPTYRATGSPSGGPAVEFDGSDELSLSSPAGLPDGADAGTIVVIVSRCSHSGSLNHIIAYGAGATAKGRGLGYNDVTWRCLDYASELGTSNDTPRHRRGVVLGHAYDGTTRRLWVDGVPVAADTPSLNTGATVMYLGRSIFGGERATCRVMTVAIYSAALTDAQWAQVMAHARTAHGVP